MKILIITLLILIPLNASAQSPPESVSLQEVYRQVESSYPLLEKKEIQVKVTDLKDKIARSGLFPEIQVNARASYQSEVTEVPFAAQGAMPYELSKDHYNFSIDFTQPLYDGGLTNARRKLETGRGKVEDAGVDTEMWKIRKLAEQVYFGILNLQKRKESVELLIDDIKEQLSSIRTKIENGVLLPGNGLVMEAELLRIQQQKIELVYEVESAFEVLSEITGKQISPNTNLQRPEISNEYFAVSENYRPELDLFDAKVNTLGLEQQLTTSEGLPKISAFAKGAYGRPGYNVFENDLHPYWMVGVQAQWSFRNWNNAGKKSEILELQKKKIEVDKEVFLKGMRSEVSRAEGKIQQLREQIELDQAVLELRKKVVEEKAYQLNEGIITSTEYLTELNSEARARMNLELRRIQLVQSRIEFLTIKGISWN